MSMITGTTTTYNEGWGLILMIRDAFKFVGALFQDLMLGDSFLGHGRRWESFVVLANLYYCLILTFVPGAVGHTEATADLHAAGVAFFVTIVFWCAFLTSFFGLFCNVKGLRYSQPLRIAGAVIGFGIWGWFALKLALIGLIASPGHVLAALTAMYEIRVVFMAAANLPRPGAPGNLGLIRIDNGGAR